jgi:hypothetical protein
LLELKLGHLLKGESLIAIGDARRR